MLVLLGGEACLYYGDERAMEGGEDPANRAAMRWVETPAAAAMQSFVRSALALRGALSAQELKSASFLAESESRVTARFLRGEETYVLRLRDGEAEERREFALMKDGVMILQG